MEHAPSDSTWDSGENANACAPAPDTENNDPNSQTNVAAIVTTRGASAEAACDAAACTDEPQPAARVPVTPPGETRATRKSALTAPGSARRDADRNNGLPLRKSKRRNAGQHRLR